LLWRASPKGRWTVRHSIQPQPSAKPIVWRRKFPDDAADEIERETTDWPDDPTEAEYRDPDETLPLPRPAFRIGDRRR
jgi:hypothetical protein